MIYSEWRWLWWYSLIVDDDDDDDDDNNNNCYDYANTRTVWLWFAFINMTYITCNTQQLKYMQATVISKICYQ